MCFYCCMIQESVAIVQSWLLEINRHFKKKNFYGLLPHPTLGCQQIPTTAHYRHRFLSGNEVGLWLARVSAWPRMREIWLAGRQRNLSQSAPQGAVLRTQILWTHTHARAHLLHTENPGTGTAHPVLPDSDKATRARSLEEHSSSFI